MGRRDEQFLLAEIRDADVSRQAELVALRELASLSLPRVRSDGAMNLARLSTH